MFFENPEFMDDEFKKELKLKLYAQSINKNVEDLTKKERRIALKHPGITRGMKDILSAVEQMPLGFSQNTKVRDDIYAKEKIMRLFQMIMIGEAYIENGKIYINQKYDTMYDNDINDVIRYDTTGDAIFTFQDPVLIENYTPDGGKKGDLVITYSTIRRFKR